MITILGKIFIISSISFGLLYLISKTNRFLFFLQALFVIFSCILLSYAFISDDFSVQNVFFYSSTKQPFIYKIAALWGNHDASLLFFASLLSLVSIVSSFYIRNEFSIQIMSFISIFIMLIIYFTSNPFFYIPNPPSEGLGMNPVLQDIAIAIHPPILYLGYVTYMIPYACFLGMLLSGKYYDMVVAYLSSKYAFGFLTIGISLGSWWAYRELGWGGYWFFDPVENISLMPWLVGIALHHSFIVTTRNGKLFSSTMALGLINFLLIAFGILVVRSGALVSVHAFASNIVGGKYILSGFLTVSFFTILLYFIKIQKKPTPSFTFFEKGIITGNILVLSASLCLMIGTLFPILYYLTKGTNISISNQYFYYLFIPLALIIVILSTIVPHLKSLFKFSLNKKNTAMVLSHSGIFILAVGVILNNLLKEDITFAGKVGTTVTSKNISVSLKNIRYSEGKNYYRQIGEFWIEDKNEIVILKPENRLYTVENAISAESDIYSFVTKDIYAVLGSLENNDTLHANIYIRPWMSLIWLGMFLTAAGIFISSTKAFKSASQEY